MGLTSTNMWKQKFDRQLETPLGSPPAMIPSNPACGAATPLRPECVYSDVR
jgi:hypothetical protein